MNIRISSPRTLRISCALVALIVAASAGPAFAQTAGGNLGVSATVTENCTLTTDPVAFGNVDVTTGAAVPGVGGIAVTCTNGVAWSADADAGAGTGASILDRRMADGANLLSYQLYTEPTRTEIWGDGEDGETIDDEGTGSEQVVPIYARVIAAQSDVPSGTYADTVVVTVTY
ncbi:MAG TPA: spore coat U domain-containing protein [Allosphingosinicella sp.]|nr:spore coat U domain-containing protein [Allosphingosinicella sp.]